MARIVLTEITTAWKKSIFHGMKLQIRMDKKSTGSIRFDGFTERKKE